MTTYYLFDKLINILQIQFHILLIFINVLITKYLCR